MIEVRQTEVLSDWLGRPRDRKGRARIRLRDRKGRARILARIRRLSVGNPGDVKPVGSGVSEMRIDYGPGYRLYFVSHGNTVVILLCGGDKGSQEHDIKRAIEMAQKL
jgi:putative addiction module killer protein